MKKLIILILLLIIPVLLLAQDRILLSEAIHQAIDKEGIEGAKKYFENLNESQRSIYEVDMKGISAISNAYMQEGNTKLRVL